MKLILMAVSFVAVNAMAVDMPSMPNSAAEVGKVAADAGKKIFEACKKEQVDFCKDPKQKMDLAALKACLAKNKEKLSPGCKTAAGL